ncbi:MAG: hypothetical protein ACI85I_001720 [Arenicella sp.]|jgi:hypothetical protein
MFLFGLNEVKKAYLTCIKNTKTIHPSFSNLFSLSFLVYQLLQ